MDNSSMALLLGITFGFGVVALAISLYLVTRAANQTIAVNGATYRNEERWSVVKDANGRVKDIVVHREATEK